MVRAPFIPEFITVHLGPPDEYARNITVPFIEYIKNVASGEIYSSWPLDAIKANVLAQTSFALNRVYNEWYRSKGYEFDITSSSSYDQSFVENRQFFETISVVVDEIFNNYIVREGQVQPLFATYCDGKRITCRGLSQWGSVSLAKQGYSPIQILKYYYGDDIEIVYNAPVSNDIVTYPGYVLEPGEFSNQVRTIKIELNRIAKNYPAIPIVEDLSVYYDVELQNAVKAFQNIFDLPVTGNVDKSTWYKIKYLYNAVKMISDLYSEGITYEEASLELPNTLKVGTETDYVRALNYFLNVISYFNENIPFLNLKGALYTNETKQVVEAFQKANDLQVTGEVDTATWKDIRSVYNDTLKNIPREYLTNITEFFPGRVLSLNMTGDDVLVLQKYLYKICVKTKKIPGVKVSGIYDSLTEQSVEYLQRQFGIEPSGNVGALTWYNIIEYSKKV